MGCNRHQNKCDTTYDYNYDDLEYSCECETADPDTCVSYAFIVVGSNNQRLTDVIFTLYDSCGTPITTLTPNPAGIFSFCLKPNQRIFLVMARPANYQVQYYITCDSYGMVFSNITNNVIHIATSSGGSDNQTPPPNVPVPIMPPSDPSPYPPTPAPVTPIPIYGSYAPSSYAASSPQSTLPYNLGQPAAYAQTASAGIGRFGRRS
jgi:hypothetical protein